MSLRLSAAESDRCQRRRAAIDRVRDEDAELIERLGAVSPAGTVDVPDLAEVIGRHLGPEA